MAVTLSRSLLREKTSPVLSWMRRRISSSGSTVVPVTSTPPTLNCGPSTTTMRMVTRAFVPVHRSDVGRLHPRLDVAVVVVERDDALDVVVELLALHGAAQDVVLALLGGHRPP